MTRDVRRAMRLLTSRDPQQQEDGYQEMLSLAGEHLDALIERFEHEQDDHGLRCWLLELIAAANSPVALPVLAAQVECADPALRERAAHGLMKLDTREARTLLWRARANGAIDQ